MRTFNKCIIRMVFLPADILIILLVSLDSEVGAKCYNLKQALQLVLYLNTFYAVFGTFSSFLAWLVVENGSLIHLLGHMTCAILVPAMASPVLEKTYKDINRDLQSSELGTNQLEEDESNEQVRSNLPPLSEAYKQDLYRPTMYKT